MPGPSQAVQPSTYAHTHAGCAPPALAQTQNISAHRSQPISRYVRDGKNRASLPPPPIISYQRDMEDGSRKGKGVTRINLASQSEQRADTQAPHLNFNKSQECECEEGALVNAPSSPSNVLESQGGDEAPPPVKRRKTGSGIKPKRKSPKPPKAWCMECGTGFGRSYDLQRHLQSAKAHSSSPAHKCRYCGIQVGREDSLLVHERIHVRKDGGRGARRATVVSVADHTEDSRSVLKGQQEIWRRLLQIRSIPYVFPSFPSFPSSPLASATTSCTHDPSLSRITTRQPVPHSLDFDGSLSRALDTVRNETPGGEGSLLDMLEGWRDDLHRLRGGIVVRSASPSRSRSRRRREEVEMEEEREEGREPDFVSDAVSAESGGMSVD
ncbi:hypothetical protein EW146_g9232 [Bondarzewia mesenterica]|uniref:C2H2-type domain-containing protein n=1 Tax=Bondarzewia mesenterica TaxID=1095465 RepID=A0A4S4L8H7_9AGAM|nr:hypothetical protein EW146_g9232 [Bondarzewia mesenterica]